MTVESERADRRGPSARKALHVLIFTGAVPAQLLGGFWGVMIYGGVVALLIFLSALRGAGSLLYDALARPQDGAAEARYVFLPLLATALGGLLSLLLVGSFAVVGYLVCGWGDAAGEVVGTRWGRHRYASPLARTTSPRRSLEGSAAVLVAGSGGAWVALLLLGFSPLPAAGAAVVCGLVGALAEALSSHGTDNFPVLLVPSLAAWWLLG